jgi:rRNA processing protein Krr1/Pno1
MPSDLVKDDRDERPLGAPDENMPIFLEPAIEDFVAVPKALIRKIIGKQAQTIIEIREKSGAFKVDARDQTSDPVLVKVCGTAEAVKKAREIIMELIESTKTIHNGLDYVEIPRAKIGMIIGLKGSQVNEIQMQTNTKIDVDFESDPCKCYIKGTDDCVNRAKQVLLTIAMQIEDEGSEYVEFPKSASGALLGPQGTRIRELQDQSGATINVDKTGNACRVRLTGSREQVADAKALIMIEIEKNRNMVPAGRPPAHADPALRATGPPGAMVVPPHQPTSFPTTLAESIARAKAAAQAVKDGLVALPHPGAEQDSYDSFA